MSTVTPFTQRQGWSPVPRSSPWLTILEILGIALGLFGMVTVLGIAVGEGTTDSAIIGGILAFFPLLLVFIAIRWIDRWEPEPLRALVLAFVWGAGVATLVSLFINTTVAAVLSGVGSSETTQAIIGSAIGAPIIEELTKGLGVLLIFFIYRRSFDGPVDGVVYGATVAAGFAFVENILYFTQFNDQLASVFVGRAIMSPFAHIIFTSMTGLMLGVAARSRSWLSWLWLFPLGLAMAMALHGLWNFSTLSTNYLLLYLFLQVPMFVGGVGLVYWLRHLERQVLQQRLSEYARAGWFSPGEVNMLVSLGERRRARVWAKRQGRLTAMKAFQKNATDLAYLRERLATGRVTASSGAEQNVLLRAVTQARAELFA
ncbi:Membrane proteinase PrsW, cleaves anti-sigma factor RsiW, M82 family [Ruaniaceae bacterium KH17]|nr:Membrane proteinase PrsW, cleaves anti-sigma factor RsiW, M82 family [Ruaniaceae bacterium KH17]